MAPQITGEITNDLLDKEAAAGAEEAADKGAEEAAAT
jgi:hypothetical protein